MPAVRKGFFHTNMQYYKISPVHLAAQINRFADFFLGPEFIMGCWELSELLGILDFLFPRNGMLCVLVILKSPSVINIQVPKNEPHLSSSATGPALGLREGHREAHFQLAAVWNLSQSQLLFAKLLPVPHWTEEQHLHRCDKQNMLWVQGGASSCPNSKLILVTSVPALQSIINQPLVQRNKHPFYFLRARTTHLSLKSPYIETYVIWTINVMHCSSARHDLPAAQRWKESWSWKNPLLGLKRAGKWI